MNACPMAKERRPKKTVDYPVGVPPRTVGNGKAETTQDGSMEETSNLLGIFSFSPFSLSCKQPLILFYSFFVFLQYNIHFNSFVNYITHHHHRYIVQDLGRRQKFQLSFIYSPLSPTLPPIPSSLPPPLHASFPLHPPSHYQNLPGCPHLNEYVI
jgi:hypothetical protein